jgi:hypothetical protein
MTTLSVLFTSSLVRVANRLVPTTLENTTLGTPMSKFRFRMRDARV